LKEIFLSDVELYFSDKFENNSIIIDDLNEIKHITKVMRHNIGDILFITDGNGNIYKTSLKKVSKDNILFEILDKYQYNNKQSNIFFCIPILRNPDRFEFALEKCVELGITNFIIYQAKRSIKNSVNINRINKILLSALKQSLQAYLPKCTFIGTLSNLKSNLKDKYIFLDQNTENKLYNIEIDKSCNYYFIFGPEGGLTTEELNLFKYHNLYSLTNNRLRSETAIISAASIISGK
jgi:16S rRNA (uracil1498-N3)-methyltransferase